MELDYKFLRIVSRKICRKYKVDDYEDVLHNAIAKFLESGNPYNVFSLINYVKYTAFDHRNIQYTRNNKNMSRVISLSDIVLMSHQYSYLFDLLIVDPEFTHTEVDDNALYDYLINQPNQNAAYYNVVKSIYINRGDKPKLNKAKRVRSYYQYIGHIKQYAKDYIKKAHHLDGLFL